MLNDEICKLREKLHESIINKDDYAITYQLSVELDQLIAEYYSTEVNLKQAKRKSKKANEKKNKDTKYKLNKDEKSITYSK